MAIVRTQKGRFAKLFIDPDNDLEATPDVELTMARDGEWTVTPSMESTTVRADGRHNKQESYAVDVALTCNLRVYADSNLTPGYTALRDACISGDPVHILVADQAPATVGAEKLEGWFEISGFTRSFPLDGFVDVPITFVETSALIDEERTPNAVFSYTESGGGGGGGGGEGG